MEDAYYYYQQPMAPSGPAPDAMDFGYPTMRPRSKTPTSLVNHTGLSPGGPLSTPPTSRDPSRGPDPPPGQYPGQMVYGDSPSNSPTSVRTPDNDSFEELALDLDPMGDSYHANGGTMGVHVSQEPFSATAENMYTTSEEIFPDQVLQDTLHASMSQVFHPQYFHAQIQSQSNALLPQQYYLGQTFDPQTAPWNSEQPMRSPDVPTSSIVLFDPVTDPTPTTYASLWTMNNTDPNYLISPNEEEPVMSSQDHFSLATQNLLQQQSHQSSQGQVPAHTYMPNNNTLGMRVYRPSPSPSTARFAPYDTNSSHRHESRRLSQQSRRPSYQNSSPIARTIELPSSMNLQSPTSPYGSASSPGGSEFLYPSYPQSESDLERRNSHSQGSSGQSTARQTRIERFSPSLSPPEMAIGLSPDPEGQPTRRQAGPIRTNGRPGGRALGTHLEPKVAKAAHDMRKIVACWHCVLQRDKCGPGDICERCNKRSQRPNADCGLGCSRIKLIELSEHLLPSLVMQIHEDSHLTHFVSQFIHRWNNQEITVYMTCEQKKMPRIAVKVYEFHPRGEELLVQLQYQTDPVTQKRYTMKKRSPALGMVHINYQEEKKYDKYLNDIVDHHLDAFGEICWAEDDNDFSPRLFKLLTRVKPKSDEEAKLLREVFRLIVCTYIMSHAITMAEETKEQTLSKMHSYTDPSAYVQNFTTPRMTSRQLKYFFARLQRNTLAAVLNKLQQIFKSSKGCDKWLAAFVAVVGLAMAAEDQQKTTHQVMSTRAVTEGLDGRDAQERAEIANRDVDERVNFVSQIFRWKYNRKCNPLRDCDQDWEKEAGFGDETSVTFVRSVAQLVRDNIDYLTQRQSVSISHSNQEKYTARLVAPFLLSFWLPQ